MKRDWRNLVVGILIISGSGFLYLHENYRMIFQYHADNSTVAEFAQAFGYKLPVYCDPISSVVAESACYPHFEMSRFYVGVACLAIASILALLIWVKPKA